MLHLRQKNALILRLAVLLIALGLAGLASVIVIPLLDAPDAAAPRHTTADAPPSTVKPTKSAVEKYDVAPDNPKYISIPAVGVVRARVLALGVNEKNEVAAPGNIYDTGWYKASSKPGQTGAMFINGHVYSESNDSVFFNLDKLTPGDVISVTKGDDSVVRYQVVKTKVYPYDNVDMAEVLAPINPEKPGLNLMTCAGTAVKGTNTFNKRLAVFAVLQS